MREKVLIKATIRQYFLKKNSTPGSHRKPMATSYLFVVGHWQLDIFNIILKTAKTWPNVLLWSLRWIHIYVGGGVIYYNANFQVPRGRGFYIGPWQKWSYSVNLFFLLRGGGGVVLVHIHVVYNVKNCSFVLKIKYYFTIRECLLKSKYHDSSMSTSSISRK